MCTRTLTHTRDTSSRYNKRARRQKPLRKKKGGGGGGGGGGGEKGRRRFFFARVFERGRRSHLIALFFFNIYEGEVRTKKP